MKHTYNVSVNADPATIKPLGDFVLVKKVSDVDLEQRYKNLIIIPAHRQGPADWVPQIGKVVAVGPGDKMLMTLCPECDDPLESMPHGVTAAWAAEHGFGICRFCGSKLIPYSIDGDATVVDYRLLMHVSVGDEVIYARWPDNDVEIRGEQYTFLHEEQGILAVIEREAIIGGYADRQVAA